MYSGSPRRAPNVVDVSLSGTSTNSSRHGALRGAFYTPSSTSESYYSYTGTSQTHSSDGSCSCIECRTAKQHRGANFLLQPAFLDTKPRDKTAQYRRRRMHEDSISDPTESYDSTDCSCSECQPCSCSECAGSVYSSTDTYSYTYSSCPTDCSCSCSECVARHGRGSDASLLSQVDPNQSVPAKDEKAIHKVVGAPQLLSFKAHPGQLVDGLENADKALPVARDEEGNLLPPQQPVAKRAARGSKVAPSAQHTPAQPGAQEGGLGESERLSERAGAPSASSKPETKEGKKRRQSSPLSNAPPPPLAHPIVSSGDDQSESGSLGGDQQHAAGASAGDNDKKKPAISQKRKASKQNAATSPLMPDGSVAPQSTAPESGDAADKKTGESAESKTAATDRREIGCSTDVVGPIRSSQSTQGDAKEIQVDLAADELTAAKKQAMDAEAQIAELKKQLAEANGRATAATTRADNIKNAAEEKQKRLQREMIEEVCRREEETRAELESAFALAAETIAKGVSPTAVQILELRRKLVEKDSALTTTALAGVQETDRLRHEHSDAAACFALQMEEARQRSALVDAQHSEALHLRAQLDSATVAALQDEVRRNAMANARLDSDYSEARALIAKHEVTEAELRGKLVRALSLKAEGSDEARNGGAEPLSKTLLTVDMKEPIHERFRRVHNIAFGRLTTANRQ